MTALAGWVKRHGVVLTATALVFVVVVTGARIAHLGTENRRLIDQANQETITRQVTDCRSAREFRSTFPSILRQLAEPSGTSIDFAAVPGFDRLDPELKVYLTALGAVLAGNGEKPNQRLLDTAARYVEAFPIQNCARLRVDLQARLSAEGG